MEWLEKNKGIPGYPRKINLPNNYLLLFLAKIILANQIAWMVPSNRALFLNNARRILHDHCKTYMKTWDQPLSNQPHNKNRNKI